MNPNLISIKSLDINKMPKKGSNVFTWIYFVLSPYKKILIPYFFLRVFRYSIFALLPTFIGFFIDAYSSGNVKLYPEYYRNISILYLSFYVSLLAFPGMFKLEGVLTENASRSLSLLGLEILNRLPISWHMKQSSGRKIDILGEGKRALIDLMILFRWQMVPVLGNMIGALVMIFIFKGPFYYAISIVLFTALYLFSAWQFGKPLAKAFINFRETNAKLVARLYEFASSSLTVKALSLESYLEKEGRRLEEEARNSSLSIFDVNFAKWTKVNFITIIFLLFFILRGYFDLLNGALSPGAFSSILMLFLYVWGGLEGLSVAQDKIYDYLSSLRRFSNLCEEGREVLSEEKLSSNLNVPNVWDSLSIENLSYSYNKGSEVLSKINFALKKNEKLAIVGSSGAGKTTLARILLKLYKPTSGSISLVSEGAKVDIGEISQEDWLRSVSYVPQEIELYDGSIRENILLGADEELLRRYEDALRNSGLKSFIAGLEKGDETIVGERGLRLSGGQRQRIGIARALLRKADIIILDEATSALDSTTEKYIQDTLFDDLREITLIIIAHRLSTIKRADQVIVLDKGELVEKGTFSELRDRGGKFSEMWENARI